MPKSTLDVLSLERRLRRIYGDQAGFALERIQAALARVDLAAVVNSDEQRWSQRDVVLITYGDQVRSDSRNPLQTLLHFLESQELLGLINSVHFLPCFPYSSDDGFSVIDYRTIDPDLGDWKDVHEFAERTKLMLDFVINHVSQDSEWFQAYLRGDDPYNRFFIEADPAADLSDVTRPRSLPLLSDFETSRGKRWLWTTFSRDQVDLNYSEPRVLAAVIEILLEYIRHGASIIRLDAIAYLWKRIGTSCIHLTETHEVVKILREVLDAVAPHVLLLTETNVPHEENVSYFGNGDEAHMVYQFGLPPLLLDAFLNEDAKPLKKWLSELQPPSAGTSYFNFTASHDGVGVRPLEGQVSEARLASLVQKIKSNGGLVSTRRQPDGTDSPYELNVSYVDAIRGEDVSPKLHAKRFLASQALMLALQGMPAIYFHSLVGTQNHYDGVKQSGIPRRINRRRFQLDELTTAVGGPGSLQQMIFEGMKLLLGVRIHQPAFHPDVPQRYIEAASPNVLCFERGCLRSGQSLLIAVNFGNEVESLEVSSRYRGACDLLKSPVSESNGQMQLKPAQVVWLEARN